MALHGLIQVNGQAIGGWSARRTTPGPPDADGAAVYDCSVTMHGENPPRMHTFRVTHLVADGALALAARVLSEAHRSRTLPPASTPEEGPR